MVTRDAGQVNCDSAASCFDKQSGGQLRLNKVVGFRLLASLLLSQVSPGMLPGSYADPTSIYEVGDA